MEIDVLVFMYGKVHERKGGKNGLKGQKKKTTHLTRDRTKKPGKRNENKEGGIKEKIQRATEQKYALAVNYIRY